MGENYFQEFGPKILTRLQLVGTWVKHIFRNLVPNLWHVLSWWVNRWKIFSGIWSQFFSVSTWSAWHAVACQAARRACLWLWHLSGKSTQWLDNQRLKIILSSFSFVVPNILARSQYVFDSMDEMLVSAKGPSLDFGSYFVVPVRSRCPETSGYPQSFILAMWNTMFWISRSLCFPRIAKIVLHIATTMMEMRLWAMLRPTKVYFQRYFSGAWSICP